MGNRVSEKENEVPEMSVIPITCVSQFSVMATGHNSQRESGPLSSSSLEEMWGLSTIILACRKLRQKDHSEFEVSLDHTKLNLTVRWIEMPKYYQFLINIPTVRVLVERGRRK